MPSFSFHRSAGVIAAHSSRVAPNPYLTDTEHDGIVGTLALFQAMVKTENTATGAFSAASQMSAGNPNEFTPTLITPGKDF
jgi:hypothetical protein